MAIESAVGIVFDSPSVEEDFEETDDGPDNDEIEISEELPEDYYEDYFPDQMESLNNPRSPHLEP